MNYVKHSDGTITYYDNQGRPIRSDMPRQSPDYYIKSDGTRVNGPFDFTEPKTLTYADPTGNVRQYQYKENAYLPMSDVHPVHLVPGLSHINGKPLNISQDYVKHSDGTVTKYPRNMQWPAVSGLGDISVGETICNVGKEEPLEKIHISEPTVQMTFGTNTSPFCGRDGKMVTASKIEDFEKITYNDL